MSHQSPQNDQLLILLNRLFETLKKKNLKSLSELNNEKLLKTIILEIEPKFESLVGKFDLTEDNSFGIRYANIVHIISLLEEYKGISTEKDKFTINTNFKNILVVNDLLKNDSDQLHLIGEILLFISAISSRKDIYIDRIGEMDELKITYYFQIIERFMLVPDRGDDSNIQSHLERSTLFNNQISKVREDYERQLNTLTSIIKESDNKNLQLKARNEALEKEINDYEMKLKFKDHDLETMKNSQAQNFKYQEQLFKDTLTASELNNQLNEKEIEVTELKKEINLLKKKHNEEVIELKDKIETLEEKLKDTKTKVTKYEKMNIKYKEINTGAKDKRANESNDPKSKEFLMKENQNLQSQVEKIMKELLGEKEKYFKQEEEKKKMEKINQELKQQVQQLQQFQQQSNNRLHIGSNKELNMNNISDVDHDNKEGFELGNDSFLCDIKEMKKGTVSEKDYNELKNENNELVKLYKGQAEDINRLSNEKEQLMTENETNKMEIDRLNREIEKIEIEKEKASIQIQKVELNYQKLQIDYERLENDKKVNDTQYKDFYEEKRKELDSYKNELNSHKTLNEKILNDKKSLLNNYTNLQKEFDKYKAESMNKNKAKVSSQKSTQNSNNNANNVNNQVINVQNETEILQLKNEIQNLKLQSLQKDDTIKTLKDNANEAKNAEDIDYYKKLYEDQKSRVNDEHKLISESLYKLAVHFMSLKDDLQKKINPNK